MDMLKNTVTKWRQATKISKARLARKIGVCRSYVTKLERGGLQPSGEVMFRIAGYFRVPIEQIFQRVEAQKREQVFLGAKSLPNGNVLSGIHNSPGQAAVQVGGRSARPSSGNGSSNGQIVGRSNGEGRGVPSRAVKPQ
jgi:DNA-binding XRE family transcriptional regulator